MSRIFPSCSARAALRARAEILRDNKPVQIVIKEVPYQQPRDALAKTIGELIKDDRIKNVKEVRDESSERQGEPVRIVLDLKREADPDLVLNQLYEFTPLQKTQSVILLALVDGRPRWLTLKEMLECYIRHRVQVIRRRTEYLLREAKRRSHILEGQLLAISSLDEVIAICRAYTAAAEPSPLSQTSGATPACARTALCAARMRAGNWAAKDCAAAGTARTDKLASASVRTANRNIAD